MESLEEPQEQEQQESTSGDVIWDDLLGNIEYEEPPEEEPSTGLLGKLRDRFTKKEQPVEGEDGETTAPAKPARKKLSGGQKIILLVLAIIVIVAYIVLGTMIRRSIPASHPRHRPQRTTSSRRRWKSRLRPPPHYRRRLFRKQPRPKPTPPSPPAPAPKVATQYDNSIADRSQQRGLAAQTRQRIPEPTGLRRGPDRLRTRDGART